ELSVAHRTIAELEASLYAQSSEVNILRQNMVSLQTSLSWRLTRPLRWGPLTRIWPHALSWRQTPSDIKILKSSGLFDRIWYLEHNPDVRASGVGPEEHYLKYGAFEGRDPSALFNTKSYLSQNEDVARSRTNPLIHYVTKGAEGRLPESLDKINKKNDD